MKPNEFIDKMLSKVQSYLDDKTLALALYYDQVVIGLVNRENRSITYSNKVVINEDLLQEITLFNDRFSIKGDYLQNIIYEPLIEDEKYIKIEEKMYLYGLRSDSVLLEDDNFILSQSNKRSIYVPNIFDYQGGKAHLYVNMVHYIDYKKLPENEDYQSEIAYIKFSRYTIKLDCEDR